MALELALSVRARFKLSLIAQLRFGLASDTALPQAFGACARNARFLRRDLALTLSGHSESAHENVNSSDFRD